MHLGTMITKLGSRKQEKKNLFQIIDKLFQSGSTTRPSYSSLESLVEDINDFFIGKIQSITNELQKRCIVNHLMQSQSPTLAQEFNLMPVSCSTVNNTIQSLSTKTGFLDLFPRNKELR